MAVIDFLLQGKGGVGKSYTATLLTQFYVRSGREVLCFDTDPVNQTFTGFKSLKVQHVRLGETADQVNPRYFDPLMEQLLEAEDQTSVVIDNGAATFLPLVGYMHESDVPQVLREAGHQVRLHSVLTGGQAFEDTVQGFARLCEYFPEETLVVWLNEFFGPIERNNVSFEDSAIFKNNAERIHALVRLARVPRDTTGHDIEVMLRTRKTFNEAIVDPKINLFARQRLKNVWRVTQQVLEEACL